MPRTRLYQYKAGSRSAKALAEALGIMRLKRTGSRFRARDDDTIINWGASDLPNFGFATVINKPQPVGIAANKLAFFQHMAATDNADVIPEWSVRPESWSESDFPIVCRRVLSGHSGAGIVIADTPDQLVSAPLYTRYIKKEHEYRIHVGLVDGNYVIISRQRKARSHDVPDDQVDWRIRNHANGFIFARNETHSAPNSADLAAIRAVQHLGLDFGAVDVVHNSRENRSYVLEVNTAPGLEGTTLTEYVEFFRQRGI